MDGGMVCFLKPTQDPTGNSDLKTMRNYFPIFLGGAMMDAWMDIPRGKTCNAVMWDCKHWAETLFVPKRPHKGWNVLAYFLCHPNSNDWHLNALDVSFCACHPCHEHKQMFVEIDIPKRRGDLQFFPGSNGTHDPRPLLTLCIASSLDVTGC